jgi:maltose alpha-D-glucosyltransferase/alpha-amylase
VPSDLWYRNALFYSLSVETFMDGNGDGVGDFRGLCERLDYLESLGVDVLWLAPVHPTPNRDDGYDITDYYAIDARFGTPGDFAHFLQEAEGRGIRVLLDLVVNHTSDRHPWFLDARRRSDSRHRDWYVWSEKRPRDAQSGVVFPGVQQTTWSFAREAGAYYFHRFYDFEPDLNTDNPKVRDEIHQIVSYWLQFGVAGFRVDAVPFLLEKPQRTRQPPTPHLEYLRELREVLQWKRGDAILLGEANIVPRDDAEYFAGGDGLHMIFNFWVNQHLFAALAARDARPLASALRATAKIPRSCQWAYFLRNHDELDLGRLSDPERNAIFAQFAPEPSMQLYGRGIRRRLAPMLGERRLIEFAYSLLFALPGAPVLRYGEEIGMGEYLRLKERNAIRTPMQWSSAPNGGFTTAEKPVRPAVDSGPFAYARVNVADELRRSGSLLRWLMKLIRVRKQTPEVGAGRWRILNTHPRVFALRYDRQGSTVVTIHNFDDAPHEISITLDGSRRLASLLDEDDSRATRGGKHRVNVDPLGYRWYRAQEF